jgi:hypothetical protein
MGEAGCWLLETTHVLNDEADEVAKSGTATETETTESGTGNGAGCDEEEEEDDGIKEVQKPDECRMWCNATNSFIDASKRTATAISTYATPS